MKKALIICSLLLGGCTVTSDRIEMAKVVCKPNGGLQSISNYVGLVKAKCKNGALFSVQENLVDTILAEHEELEK